MEIAILLGVVVIVILGVTLQKLNTLSKKLNGLETKGMNENDLNKLKKGILDDFKYEISEVKRSTELTNRDTRMEITQLFNTLGNSLASINKLMSDTTSQNLEQTTSNIDVFLNKFKEVQNTKFDELIEVTKSKLDAMSKQQDELVKATEDKLDKVKETVDEKLQSTLSSRIGESFKQVSDQLESVYKSIGEMQSLANNVGDLKRVLSNVKTRGIFGEVQLENILEQFMVSGQYEKDVVIKPNSREKVEFAVKLPGKDGETVLLPIDSKFPMDIYDNLVKASIEANAELVDKHTKDLHAFIKKSAKDIASKYIDVPKTTEFGILFLPTEGLYAEVVRDSGLVESIQKEYKIIISGPNTLSALLTSLQVGFRTLAIEKKSSEVWLVLSAVKDEFEKFEKTLDATQKKLNTASAELDKLIGTRTKAINRKLREVESLGSDSTSVNMFDDYTDVNE